MARDSKRNPVVGFFAGLFFGVFAVAYYFITKPK